jgi:hypothetical protein
MFCCSATGKLLIEEEGIPSISVADRLGVERIERGVRLVWITYLPTRNVWAFRPDGTAKVYRATDTLPGEDVLRGFAIPIGELFEGV